MLVTLGGVGKTCEIYVMYMMSSVRLLLLIMCVLLICSCERYIIYMIRVEG